MTDSLVQEQVSLQDKNTLGLPSVARFFSVPQSLDALGEVLAFARKNEIPVLVLGEGSNVVVAEYIDALVLCPGLKGIRVLDDNAQGVLLDVAAGEHWDSLVAHCVSHGWYGLENLSLIPGSVGAAPFQNIGAYGVEVADCLTSVTVMDIATGDVSVLQRDACAFGYRDSIFKSGCPGRWVITSVTLQLTRQFQPVLGYADLSARFQSLPESQQNASGLRDLVIALRNSKLPDPASLANAGSFFKNPEVSAAQHAALRQAFPDLVSYALADGQFKLAAGWLIDRAGWKGRRRGAMAMHTEQALVMVNHGGASVAELRQFAEAVRDAVEEMFGVALEQEPVLFGW